MKNYLPIITLNKNGRGMWDLDTTKGCSSGMKHGPNGCYDDCYAHRSAKIRGYDFNTTVLRHFKSFKHERKILKEINNSNLPFIRIGNSGDPSENWNHTFNILIKIKKCNKEIVIVTKHWTKIPDELLHQLKCINVCVNTSISALDTPEEIDFRLTQYNRLKPYCKSILRIVSCDFNKENEMGYKLSLIQDLLFQNVPVIDTVFRPSKNNQLVTNRVINISVKRFLNSKQIVSKFNKKAYLGKCETCKDKCGIFDEKLRQKPYFIQPSLF